MTGAGASAADSHGVDEIQDIDLDQASDRDSAVGSTMDSYADKGKLNREQNKVLQRLLTLAFTMCGIPFACVANTHMKHVLKVLKPSFDPPGRPTSFISIVQVLLSHNFAGLITALYPGTTTMRTSLLEGLLSEVQLQHAAWLADDNLGRHLTMALDGWSNARMESVYAFNIIFPDRRVILLKSEDLSTTTHSGQNIAGGGSSWLMVHVSAHLCIHRQWTGADAVVLLQTSSSRLWTSMGHKGSLDLYLTMPRIW